MNNLRKLRKERNLTLEDVGKVIGRSRQHVSIMELGVRPIPLKYANKLANYFGVSPDEIYGEESFKQAKYLVTTLKNIESHFSKKKLKYEDYVKNGVDDTYFFYKDILLLPILHNLFNTEIDIQDNALELVKNLSEIIKEKHTSQLVYSDVIKINKQNKVIYQSFNKKIDNLIKELNEYKIDIDKLEKNKE